MYYLYAHTKDSEGNVVDVALVGAYTDFTQAVLKRDTEVMCFSDEGLNYSLHNSEVSPPPNCHYNDLIERTSK